MADTTLTGNLAGDPELRHTASGRPVANFTVIENRRKRDPKTNAWVDDEPLPMRCTVWGDLAQHVAESLSKGDRVTVSGRLVPEVWEKDGEKRRSVALAAEDVAASLRFADVAITRAPRAAAPADDPWASNAA